MQNCFRQYPEIYGSEIDNDDDDDMTADAAADVSTPADVSTSNTPESASNASDAPVAQEPATTKPVAKEPKTESVAPASSGPHSAEKVEQNRRELGLVPENYRPEEKAVKGQEETSESESLVPKAAHDGR